MWQQSNAQCAAMAQQLTLQAMPRRVRASTSSFRVRVQHATPSARLMHCIPAPRAPDTSDCITMWHACNHISGHCKQIEEKLLLAGIVEAAAEALDAPKRLWMLGGITAMDVPGSTGPKAAINDLPIIYRLPYRHNNPSLPFHIHGPRRQC